MITGNPRIAWLQQHVHGDSIVDIGCNEGTFRNHEMASHTTGVDIDKWDPPGYARFVQADAAHMPFSDKEFDGAALGDVLEHVSDPVQVLKEANRIAKKIWFSVPNEYRWSKNTNPFTPLNEVLASKGITYEEGVALATTSHSYCKGIVDDKVSPHLFHVRYFTAETLCNTFKQAGLGLYVEMLDYDTNSLDAEGSITEAMHWSFFVGWSI